MYPTKEWQKFPYNILIIWQLAVIPRLGKPVTYFIIIALEVTLINQLLTPNYK